ncbi:MAG TPA: hypothetical protein VFU76_12505 [Terriglobales bacterium]|nr:hypothetical protein [Terriglobales bacterium]
MRHNPAASRIIRATAVVVVLFTVPVLQYRQASHHWFGAILASEILFAWFLDTFSGHLARAWFWAVTTFLVSVHCALVWLLLGRWPTASAHISVFLWSVLVVAEAVLFLVVAGCVENEAREQALGRRPTGND